MSAKKILIVEDETKIARIIQLELEYEGYAVNTAQLARKAWSRQAGKRGI